MAALDPQPLAAGGEAALREAAARLERAFAAPAASGAAGSNGIGGGGGGGGGGGEQRGLAATLEEALHIRRLLQARAAAPDASGMQGGRQPPLKTTPSPTSETTSVGTVDVVLENNVSQWPR